MKKADIIRVSIMSLLLLGILLFYTNLGFLSFTNVNVNETLPKPVVAKKDIKSRIISTSSVEEAKELNLGFELVGVRGNNPESTIIILKDGTNILVEQGENVTPQITFSHIEAKRAYFFDGKDYSFLDIIGSEKSFNQNRIDLNKD